VLDARDGKLADARARIEARVAANQNNPTLLVLAARTYAVQRDFAATEKALRQAITADPSYLPAYSMLGQLYTTQKRLDEARAGFEELARRMPKLAGPPTMVGMIFDMQKNTEQARVWYERALFIDATAAVAANNLAWLLADTGGNLDVALQHAQAAKAQLADLPEVDDTLGWVYYKKGLASLAIRSFEESVKKDAKNAMYHYHLGLAHLQNGDKDKARHSLKQALSLNPAFAGAAEAQKTLATL